MSTIKSEKNEIKSMEAQLKSLNLKVEQKQKEQKE